MGIRLFLILMLSAAAANADESTDAKAIFCSAANHQQQEQTIRDENNRIAFKNAGGLINGGVCWWHSRLQRSATYLAVFRPELPKPTSSREVRYLLRDLKHLNRVVEIPGYANFNEFTADWQPTIQKFLNAWQIQDGVLYQAWIRGLQGSPRGNPEKLQDTIMNLKEQVVDLKRISYLKLQLPGITSHAWLVVGMDEIANGYHLTIVDSNKLTLIEYDYHWGDASITFGHYGSFMIYLEQTQDFEAIADAVSDYCS